MVEGKKPFKVKPWVAWVGGVTIVLVGFIIAGAVWFASSNDNESTFVAGEPLLVVSLTGGLCGEGVVCESEHTIGADGSFEGFNSLTDSQVVELKRLIGESKLKQFEETDTKMCASYYDGADLGIQVPSWGDEVYTPCLLLDAETDPLVVYVEGLLM